MAMGISRPNDSAYKATPFAGTMFPNAEPVVLYFRDVHMPRNRKQGTSAHVQIFIEQWPGWPEDITALHPRIIPQRWAIGEVTVGEKRVPAAMIDRNWDETYVEKRGLNLANHRDFPRGRLPGAGPGRRVPAPAVRPAG